MAIYADTSFICSCYIQDANTAAAQTVFATLNQPLVFTAFHRLELRTAFGLAVFRQRISEADARLSSKMVNQHLRSGLLVPTRIDWLRAFRDASRLSSICSIKFGTRSLDILHVALARQLSAAMLLTFDKRQADSARSVGLQVLPEGK